MTAPQCKAQVAEIQHLCRYITSDRAIANYLGIPTEQVAGVRSRMPKSGQDRYWLHRREGRYDETPPPVERDPCPWCNVRRDIGCRHNVSAAQSTENLAAPLAVVQAGSE